MVLSFKVRFLNLFRNFFRIPPFESALASLTTGQAPSSFISKFAPNPYQYKEGTFRLMQRHGIKMRVDVSDYIGHMIYFGFREQPIENLFSLCTPGANILDVGTNVGWTLLKMASLSGTGSVMGFEPDPYNYGQCVENLALNNFRNISIFPVGLSDVNARLSMEVRTPSNRGGNRIAKGEGYRVTVVRLDDFEPIKILEHIDIIKIDVEGHELNVLKGAEATLRRHHPVLFIEVNDNNLRYYGHSAGELLQFLASAGYNSIVSAEDAMVLNATDNFANRHFDVIAHK